MSPDKGNELRGLDAASGNSGPLVFFVAHNRNHVRMFAASERLLRRWGYRTMFCVPLNFVHAHHAVAELERRGLIARPLDRMIESARRGDVVVVGIDGAPQKLHNALVHFEDAGIHTVGMIEGARFPKPKSFGTVRTVLVWGQSGVEAYGARAKDVGSVVVEDKMRRKNPSKAGRLALVNYKFTWQDSESDLDHSWLHAALNACKEFGFEPVLSCHPAEPHEIPGITWSERTIEDLLADSALVVTRSSTVIYQALASGVQPFLFPIAGEELYELADPMDSFPICLASGDLCEAIAQWVAADMPRPGMRFLDRHVSVLPNRPAFQRVAEALLELAGSPS